MKTIEVKIFEFSELSPEAQQTAIKKEIERAHEFLSLDTFNDDANEKIKEAGFINPVLSYSLSCCQGDGLSFKADKYDKLVDLFIQVLGPGKERTAKLLADSCAQVFKGNTGHYSYAHKSQVDLYLDEHTNVTDTKNIDGCIAQVLTLLEDIYMKLCKELENQGYKEIEYLTSEECARENLEFYNFEFTEDGKIY